MLRRNRFVQIDLILICCCCCCVSCHSFGSFVFRFWFDVRIHIKLLFITFTIRTHGGCCHVAFLHACTNTQTRKFNRFQRRLISRYRQTFLYIYVHTNKISIGSRNLPKSTKILGRFFFVLSFRIFSILVFFHVCHLLGYMFVLVHFID